MSKQLFFSRIPIAAALIFAFAVGVQAYIGTDELDPPATEETPKDNENAKNVSSKNHGTILVKIDLHPNPAHNELNVGAKNMKQIEIIDMAGRIIIKKTHCSDTERLDISSLRESLYFIRVTTTDDKVAVAKFIKK